MHIAVRILFCVFLFSGGCRDQGSSLKVHRESNADLPDKYMIVLGIAQDGGFPQIGCEKACCTDHWKGREVKKNVSSLALVDRKSGSYWIIEATPDIGQQLKFLQDHMGQESFRLPEGIFISHAHIGHYAGLMYLGREAFGAQNIPVHAMPRMDSFLRTNGPWSQLVTTGNISLKRMKEDSVIRLGDAFKISPFRVPHRDEYSETVGFRIEGPNKTILFIPDIDKWEKWKLDIRHEVQKVDVAFLDGTFFKEDELPGRDMREIPHPLISESLTAFSDLPATEKKKIVFIHFNHTNPLLKRSSAEKDSVVSKGFGVAHEGMVTGL